MNNFFEQNRKDIKDNSDILCLIFKVIDKGLQKTNQFSVKELYEFTVETVEYLNIENEMDKNIKISLLFSSLLNTVELYNKSKAVEKSLEKLQEQKKDNFHVARVAEV